MYQSVLSLCGLNTRHQAQIAFRPRYALLSICLACVLNSHSLLAQTTTNTNQDATTQSSRERERILLKRSPIASEYQPLSTSGTVYGASFDAEGVDFRAQFRLPKGKTNQSQVKASGKINYQSIINEYVPAGSIQIAQSFGKLTVQFNGQKNSSERFIDLYQSRWLVESDTSLSDTDTMSLGYPRYSQDSFDTASINLAWRADYQLSKNSYLTYEGLNTNFDDLATRNRFEIQFGAGDLTNMQLADDNSTIQQASVSEARIRRYYHRLVTARDISRHRIGYNKQNETGSLEMGAYYSKWVNDRVWLPWNFVDSDISATYSVANRYLPDVTVTNSDIYDVTNAVFANFRQANTVTTDTDYAFVLDWDKKYTWANHDLWINAGAAWRTKERAVNNKRAVYGATSDTFNLSALTGNNTHTRVIDDGFLLPVGMDTALGNSYFTEHESEQFELNLSQSFIETIQDIYTSEETVNALYLNAYQQRKNWFWRAGLRFESTKTATRGAVYDAEGADTLTNGEKITSITLNGEIVEENFDSFDAAFITGGNSYQHFLPSLELRYATSPQIKLKTSYFQRLMRPQYFDTVSYKRVNVATLSITEGTPDLEATLIHNTYAGFEYIYSEQGQISAGIYYKRISDFFYDSTDTELIDDELYEVSSVQNGKNGYIQGMQGYWQQTYEISSLAKANVKFAYTYSDSHADLGNRSITMPERAKHRAALNLALFMQNWHYRSQFSWQSHAIDDVGATAAQDTTREKVVVWNQSLAWQSTKQWLVKFSLNNVLDYPERSHQGQKHRVLNNLYSGTTASLQVMFTL